MSLIRLDHFLSYTSAKNIDAYLKVYESFGFIPMKQTVRHNPGVRNGFIKFGPDYLELFWVEDEEEFQTKADQEDKFARQKLHPFSIGIVSTDLDILRQIWIKQGLKVGTITYGKSRDADPASDPRWAFLSTPAGALPGIGTFILRYLSKRIREDRIKEIIIPPNRMYGITGLTFVTQDPHDRASQWQIVLAPEQEIITRTNSAQLVIGAHEVSWITASLYEQLYKKPWIPATYSLGELAIIHLLSDDLQQTQSFFNKEHQDFNWLTGFSQDSSSFLLKSPLDGFQFAVSEYPIKTWIQERTARTGESIVIKNNND